MPTSLLKRRNHPPVADADNALRVAVADRVGGVVCRRANVNALLHARKAIEVNVHFVKAYTANLSVPIHHR